MDFSIGKKIATFFKSRKLAVVLIFLIIVFSIIGTHIPQESQLKPDVYNAWKVNHPAQADIFEKLGFTHMFSSFIFISLAGLLFVNTLFCTVNMLTGAFRRLENKQFQKKTFICGLENNSEIKTEKEPEDVISGIYSVLKSSGYNVSQEENCIFAQKNRLGTLGTSLFHACILFIIVASVYGSTGRMEGDMRLIEGQTLSEEEHGNYKFINEGPFFNEKHRKFDITLEKFYPDYKDETGTPRGPAGKLVIMENGKMVKTDMVYSNHLVTYKGYTFLGNVYGMAPILVLSNPDGTIYDKSSVEASDLDKSGRYVAYFNIGDTGLEGGLMVYMTAPLTEVTESGDVKQTPIMFLKIFDKGKEIYDGTLRLNDRVGIHDNYLDKDIYIVFYDIKYWSNFYIVKDDGTRLVYAGVGLITISLMIIFFIVPKRIWVEIVRDESNSATGIYIGGKADKFRSLYEEEYSNLVNKIEERLSNGTD